MKFPSYFKQTVVIYAFYIQHLYIGYVSLSSDLSLPELTAAAFIFHLAVM